MAKPIEPTPIFDGKAAEQLLRDIEENVNHDAKKERHFEDCRKIFATIGLNK